MTVAGGKWWVAMVFGIREVEGEKEGQRRVCLLSAVEETANFYSIFTGIELGLGQGNIKVSSLMANTGVVIISPLLSENWRQKRKKKGDAASSAPLTRRSFPASTETQ